MTKQQIFNRVANGLLKQNSKALNDNGSCDFITKDGKRCALGFLLPKNWGINKLNESWIYLGKHFPACVYGAGYTNDYAFFDDLREIHNRHNPIHWKKLLIKLAEKYGLDNKIVYETTNTL